jgi:predicted ribosome-associated RNA-binding protein Tma20
MRFVFYQQEVVNHKRSKSSISRDRAKQVLGQFQQLLKILINQKSKSNTNPNNSHLILIIALMMVKAFVVLVKRSNPNAYQVFSDKGNLQEIYLQNKEK